MLLTTTLLALLSATTTSLASPLNLIDRSASPWKSWNPSHGPSSHHNGGPGPWHPAGAEKKAVYFLRADPAGSNVVAVAAGADGTLMNSTSVTPTGGNGLQSLNATAAGMPPVELDPLQGQQAVSIGGEVR